MALTEEQKRKLQAKAEAEIAARKLRQEKQNIRAVHAADPNENEARKLQQEKQEGYHALPAQRSASSVERNVENSTIVNNSIFVEAKTSSIETVLEARVSRVAALVPSVVTGFIFAIFLGIYVGFILGGIMFLVAYIDLRHIKLSVSNRRICGQTGIVHIDHMESPLEQVSNVRVDRSVMGSLLGYGTVVVSTNSSEYYFGFIKNADSFQQSVMKRIHQYKEDYATRQAVKIAMAMREAGLNVNNNNV